LLSLLPRLREWGQAACPPKPWLSQAQLVHPPVWQLNCISNPKLRPPNPSGEKCQYSWPDPFTTLSPTQLAPVILLCYNLNHACT
jgi:hypothetical protein